MLTKPTWHEAKAEAEARESEAEAKEIFEAEDKMYETEAEARYSRNINEEQIVTSDL